MSGFFSGNAVQINGVDQTVAWTTYTPTLSANSGTLGAGNTASGRYRLVGKTCHFAVSITIGAAGIGTANYLKFSLPFTTAAVALAWAKRTSPDGVSCMGDSGGSAATMLINKYDASDPLANSAVFAVSGTFETT